MYEQLLRSFLVVERLTIGIWYDSREGVIIQCPLNDHYDDKKGSNMKLTENNDWEITTSKSNSWKTILTADHYLV